jgi:integrase
MVIVSKSKSVHLNRCRIQFLEGTDNDQRTARSLQRFNALPDDAVLPSVHDLRRTVVTRMAELDVQPHIIEAVLNHVSGHKGGVAGIYNRATYDKENEALNLWAEHVMATVESRAATVAPLRRQA